MRSNVTRVLDETDVSKQSDYTVARFDPLFIALCVLIVLSLYINLFKVVVGTRYVLLLTDVIALGLVGAAVLRRLMHLTEMKWMELSVAFLVFMGLIGVAYPNVPDVATGAEGFRRVYLHMPALLVGVTTLRSRRQLLLLGQVVLVASIPIMLYGIKQFFWISGFDERFMAAHAADVSTGHIFGKVRAFSIFSGPFHLGIFTGFVFWIALAFYTETRRKWYLAALSLAVLACLATLTRSGLLAIVGSTPIVLLYVFKKSRLKTAIVLASFMLLGVGAFFGLRAGFENIDNLATSISDLETITEDSRLQTRYDGYSEAMMTLRTNLFGLGTGSAADAMGDRFEPANSTHITSHNILLRVAIELGWVGLSIFIILLVQIGLTVRQLRNRHDDTLAILLGGCLSILLITGITGSCLGAYPMNMIFWVIAGGAAGVMTHQESASRSSHV